MPKTTKSKKSKKSKTTKKQKKMAKPRPPRIFIKKGKLYVRVGKKNFLLKDQQDYTKRELIDIILKELVVRRKSRKRGTVTKKERKKDRDDMKIFHEFEKLNKNQSKYLKLPTAFNQKSQAAQSIFNGFVKSFTTLPGDVNIETRALAAKEAKKQGKLKKPSPTLPTSPGTKTTPTVQLPPITTTSGRFGPLIPPTSRSTVKSPDSVLAAETRRFELERRLKDEIKKEIKRVKFKNAKKFFAKEMRDIGGPQVKSKSTNNLTDLVYEYYESNNQLNNLEFYLSQGRLFESKPPMLEEEEKLEPTTEEKLEPTAEGEEEGDVLESKADSPSSEATSARQSVLEMVADGKFYTGKGLMTSEIDKMMNFHPDYIGTYPANFYKFLPKKLPKRFGFIMNLDKSNKPGSHWVAVHVDAENDLSIEYYDSFAEPPTKNFMREIKKVVDELNPNVYLKFKVNGVVDQKTTTSNCGWHCMNFLLKRFMDKPFKEATKYDNSSNGEDEVQQLKQKFGYI